MSSEDLNPKHLATLAPDLRIQSLRLAFESDWQEGLTPHIEQFLAYVEESERSHLVYELVSLEVRLLRQRGDTPVPQAYLQRFFDYSDEVQQAFRSQSPPFMKSLVHDGVPARTLSLAEESLGVRALQCDDTDLAETISEIAAPNQDARVFLDRYRLLNMLGRGGFGQVWRGMDLLLKREVAIKILRSDRKCEPKAVEQFLREGQKLAGLKHPGVLKVHDVGFENECGFIVTDLVEGTPLERILKMEGVSIADSIRIVAAVADALHAVHLQDMVHRDVKPSNIVLDRNGEPILIDFGLAITETEILTEGPNVTGTFAYMSPEQVTGFSHTCDARSDVYGLGVVLYRLLTGRLPFLAKTAEDWRQQIVERDPRPPRTINDEIDSDLERICLQCLEKDKSKRFSTCRDLADRLRAAARPHVKLESPSAARPIPPGTFRRKNVALGLGLSVCLITGLGVMAINSRSPSEGNLPPQQLLPSPAKAGFFEQEPLPLVIPSATDQALQPVTTTFDIKKRKFFINSSDFCFYTLEQSPDNRYLFDIQIQKSAHHGVAGVFFGFSPIPDDDDDDTMYWSCHTVQLVCFIDQSGKKVARLERHRFKFLKQNGQFRHIEDRHGPAEIVHLTPAGLARMQIRVKDQRIEMIRWNDQELIDLVTNVPDPQSPTWSCEGSIGVANLYGAVDFMNAKLIVE